MKKVTLLTFAIILFFCSCSDDDTTINNEVTASLLGTWKMTTYTAVTAVDYNGDGVFSNNIFSEASCLQNNIQLKFNENGTLEYNSIHLKFNGPTGAFLDCTGPKIEMGTYTVKGKKIVITTYNTETHNPSSFTVTKSGNKLTNSWTGNMAGFYEFTKQE